LNIEEFFQDHNLLYGDRLRRQIIEMNGAGKPEWVWQNSFINYWFGVDKLPRGRVIGAGLGYPWNMATSLILIIDPDGSAKWRYAGEHLANPHEARWTKRNTIIVPCCFNDRVYEISRSDRKIVWSWFAADHFKRPPNYVETIPFGYQGYANWTHINDAIELKNGNVLISLRNLSTIVEVSKEDYGEIIWEWGPGVLAYQHRLQELPNGRIMIADSENNRIIEVDKEREAIVWEFQLPAKEWCRSGVRIGDLTVISTSKWDYVRKNTGMYGNTWTSKDRILLVAMDGEILWEHKLPDGTNIYNAQPVRKVADEFKGRYSSSVRVTGLS